MSFIKRTTLYLTRNKMKSVLLFSIITLLLTLSMLSLIISKTSENQLTALKESIGGSIIADTSSESITLDSEFLNTIKSIEEIKEINGSKSILAQGSDFTNIKGTDTDPEQEKAMPIIGIQQSALHTKFHKQVYQLLSGRHIEPNDQFTAIISEELAKQNTLTIGDTITIRSLQEEEAITSQKLTIVGLFKNVEESVSNLSPSVNLPENTIFTDLHTVQTLRTGTASLDSIEMFVQNPDYVDSTIDLVKEIAEKDSLLIHFTKNNDLYETSAKPIKDISDMVSNLLLLIIVISMIVITLTLFMRIKDRNQEAGILLTIGKTKIEIVMQYITEVIITTMLAFICSYFISNGFASTMISFIFSNAMNDLMLLDTASIMSINDIVLFGLLSHSVVILATIIASLSILRYKPKEILTKLS